MRSDRARPRGTERLEQRVPRRAREDRPRAAKPDVGLGIRPLGPQPVVHFLRAHVEPVHDDIRVELLEAVLEQGEEIAAVGRIDDEGRSSIAPAARNK